MYFLWLKKRFYAFYFAFHKSVNDVILHMIIRLCKNHPNEGRIRFPCIKEQFIITSLVSYVMLWSKLFLETRHIYYIAIQIPFLRIDN